MASLPIVTIRYKTFQWNEIWPFTIEESLIVGAMVLAAVSFVLGFFARGL